MEPYRPTFPFSPIDYADSRFREKSESDWICVDVCDAQEDQSKSIRAERDRKYGNLYLEKSTDERWVGDLGEIVINDWLGSSGLKGFQWITQESAGAADFVTEHGERIGAKTVKRQSAPRLGYTAQISARHAAEPADWFVFMTSVIAQKKVWILGAIESNRFLEEAQYHGAGHKVHDNYTVRAGHEIYKIELDKLIPPTAWLKQLSQLNQFGNFEHDVHQQSPALNAHRQCLLDEQVAMNEPKESESVVRRNPWTVLFRPKSAKKIVNVGKLN